MAKKIVLIGQCGFDGPRLQALIEDELTAVEVKQAHDEQEVEAALAGASLALFNRELQGDFADDSGVKLLADVRRRHPNVKAMLVSDRPDAQAAAAEAGAIPGFGKAELEDPRVVKLLKDAVGKGEG